MPVVAADDLEKIKEIAVRYAYAIQMGLIQRTYTVIILKGEWTVYGFEESEDMLRYLRGRAIRDRSDIDAVGILDAKGPGVSFRYATKTGSWAVPQMSGCLPEDIDIAPSNMPNPADLWRYHNAAVENCH